MKVCTRHTYEGARTMTGTPTTPNVRMIPARALSLPELEEIVRALVESHNAQCKAAEDFILSLDDAPKVGA